MRRMLLFILLLSACGSPPTKDGPSENNGATNNRATNNVTTNNVATNGSSNNVTNSGSNNAATNNTNAATNNTTCEGCLDEEGSCVPGDSPDACGGQGERCGVCSDGWVCADGTCAMPPTCGPDNCDGCCDSVGQCREGLSDATCGVFGAACEECTGTESCDEGTCERPCSETCAGCCDGETCMDGDVVAACGAAGEACEQCSGQSECSGGQCVALDCSQTCAGCCDGSTCLAGDAVSACGDSGDACVACVAGQSCQTGACVVDPASRWELILVSGEVSPTNAMGEEWDLLAGPPDPLVVFELTDPTNGVQYSAESSVVDNDSTPSWNESVLRDVPARAFEDIIIDVYDSDFDLDDFVCGVQVDLSGNPAEYQELFTGALFTASCTDPNNSSVFAEVDFRLQPD